MTTNKEQTRREDDRAAQRDHDEERDDASAFDAPTATEENEGMSTILSADTMDGVQQNEGDE